MDMIVFSRLLRHMVFAAAVVGLGGLSMPMALGAADNISYQGNFPVSTAQGMTHATLTINGVSRDLLIYRPSAAQSLPLMIYFDGTGNVLTGNIALTGIAAPATALVYRYSAANLNAIVHDTDQAVSASSVSAAFPANSITLLVIK
jgi:hypothetical protein